MRVLYVQYILSLKIKMLKLINLSTYNYDMDRYGNNSDDITKFLENNNIDAIELLNPLGYCEKKIPKKSIKGIHLKHYPMWLDFWNNKDEIFDDFKSEEDIIRFYGGRTKKAIIDQYREEIIMADNLNAEYVVFHVSNVKLKHCYNYDFTYTDKEVIDCTIELVNEIFDGLDTNITILFENLWWPGLRMIDKDIVSYFLENINYQNKGLMLDTGHLLNTNLDIESEEDGIDYILDTISNLGKVKEYIKGIHLSKSTSSKYVKEQLLKYKDIQTNFEDLNSNVIFHIIKIDEHKPFTNSKIKELIDLVNPSYLVYEFITTSIEELSDYIRIQDEALGLSKGLIEV